MQVFTPCRPSRSELHPFASICLKWRGRMCIVGQLRCAAFLPTTALLACGSMALLLCEAHGGYRRLEGSPGGGA